MGAGKHVSRDGWAGNLKKHRRAVSNIDAAFMRGLDDVVASKRTSSNTEESGSPLQPRLDRLQLDDAAGGRDSPGRQRRHSRYKKSLEMPA